MTTLATKTYSIRLKDRHAAKLSRMSRDVNFVWNYVNELSYRNIREKQQWLSGYDLQKFTAGGTKFLEVNAGTIDSVCAEYATRRKQFKKAKLRWRSSGGGRKSLGWIPVKGVSIKSVDEGIKYDGYVYKLLDKSYSLAGLKLGAGSFSEDATGRWYINVTVKIEHEKSAGTKAIGIDLGLKSAATCSDGFELKSKRFAEIQSQLAMAQRAAPMTAGQVRNEYVQRIAKAKKLGHVHTARKLEAKMKSRAAKAPRQLAKNCRAKALHRKAKNLRKNDLHKFSRTLVDNNAAIFVGDVNAKAMQKLFGKSSADAAWGELKTMLKYKSDRACVVFEEVNESYTTQACSSCHEISDSSPKGRAGLVIRRWTCGACNVTHDRDVNAAKNIAERGMALLAGGKSR